MGLHHAEDLSLIALFSMTWHGGEGSTLEMRVFAEIDLLQILADTGFKDIKIWHEDAPEFGILQAQQGGGFVITAIKDNAAIPLLIAQHDPYYENIYPKETALNIS